MAIDPALRALVNKINKAQPGSIILGSEVAEEVPRITSGSLALDVILGGGWPANQWQEIYGEFSSGKTAVVLKTIAANQALDSQWTCWWLAAEHFDRGFARLCGVDLDRVYVHNTNAMEEGLQAVLEVAESRAVDCVVIDSLPQLIPDKEDENEIGELVIGTAARVANQFFRKQGKATRRSLTEQERPVTGFVINQFREKIGVMKGDPRVTPVGRGKDFAYYTRVELRRDDWITQGDQYVGQVIKAVTKKNKSHRPNRMATFSFYFDEAPNHPAGSYDTLAEIVDLSIAFKVLRNAGSWFYFGEGEDAPKFQGRNGVANACREDEILAKELSKAVLGLVKPQPAPKKAAKPVKKLAKKVAK